MLFLCALFGRYVSFGTSIEKKKMASEHLDFQSETEKTTLLKLKNMQAVRKLLMFVCFFLKNGTNSQKSEMTD